MTFRFFDTNLMPQKEGKRGEETKHDCIEDTLFVFISSPCTAGRCAWFDNGSNECAVLTLSKKK